MSDSEVRIPKRLLNCFRPVSDFPLSVRTTNVLRARDIHLIGELMTYDDDDVIAWSDKRMRVYQELKSLLNSLELDFFPSDKSDVMVQ